MGKDKVWVFFTALLFIAIGIGAFLFFKGYFDAVGSSFGEQIMAAVLGTVMISMITAVLLKAQSRSEEQKEKSLGIFQRKFEIYSNFLDFLFDVIEDGKLEAAELKALSKWVSRIALVGGADVSDRLFYFYEQCTRFIKFRYADLSEQEKIEWRDWHMAEFDIENPDEMDFISIGELVGLLRVDLGETALSERDQAGHGSAVVDLLVDGLCEARQRAGVH